MMSIPRTLFEEDHEAFRDTVRRFMEQEVAPHHARWEAQSHVDREIWNKAGAAGLLCATMPEEYGGVGVDKRGSEPRCRDGSLAASTVLTKPGWPGILGDEHSRFASMGIAVGCMNRF